MSRMMETDTKNKGRTRAKEEAAEQKLVKNGSAEQEEEAEGKPSAVREGETKKTHAAEGEGKKKKEKNREKKHKKTNKEDEEGKTQPRKKKKGKVPSTNMKTEESTMETATMTTATMATATMATATMTTATMATATGTMTDHKLTKGEAEVQDGSQPTLEAGEEVVKMAFGGDPSREDAHARRPESHAPHTQGLDREQPTSTPPSSVGMSNKKSPLAKKRMYVDDLHKGGSPVLTSKQLQVRHQDLEGSKETATVSAKVSLAKVSAEQQVQMEEWVVVDQPMRAVNVAVEEASMPNEETLKMKKRSMEPVSAGLRQETYTAEVVMPKDAEVEEKVQQFSFIDSDEEGEEQGTGHAQRLHKPAAEEVRRQDVHQPLQQEVAKPEDSPVQQELTVKAGEGADGSTEKEKKKKKKKTSEQAEEEPTKSKRKKKKSAHGGEKKKSSSKKSEDAAPLATTEAASSAPPWASGLSLPMFDVQMDATTAPSLDKPAEESSLSANIFDELAKSSSVGDILRDIEDQIKEMETGLSEPPIVMQPPSTQTAEPTLQVVHDQNKRPSFENTIQDLARELEKLGESESAPFSTSATSAVQPQQAAASRRRMVQQEVTTQQQTQSIIEDYLVQKLVEVNRTLTEGGDNLPTWDLVQLQQEHNQLVQMVITQALSARETGLDTQALAQGIATALHQLDHFTISQIMAGINQGSKWNLHRHSAHLQHLACTQHTGSHIHQALTHLSHKCSPMSH